MQDHLSKNGAPLQRKSSSSFNFDFENSTEALLLNAVE